MFTIMAKLDEMFVDPEVQRLMQEVEALRLELQAMGQRLADAERLADRDVLTPLLNRRAFVREVQRAIALTRRHKTPASVIYFDMDGFKQINDRYGHAGGDAALIGVAERLMAEVREADVVGRIGGDEFAVLLQHADAAAAAAKAAALVQAVANPPLVCDGQEMTVQLSWGVRQVGAVDSAEQALAEADAAMYLRKPSRN
jgi:diguanylate cyclase (GGDEF)-like protein